MKPKFDHFSIDTQTLSFRFDAAIISIGCVNFNPETGKFGDKFYMEIDLKSAIECGHVQAETLSWWMAQKPEARRVFEIKEGELRQHLATALAEFSKWMRDLSADPIVWANGAADDIAWLNHAYATACVGTSAPWRHGNVRDLRTASHLAGYDGAHWPFPEAQHHALQDAYRQADIISTCWQKIKQPTLNNPNSVMTATEDIKGVKAMLFTGDTDL